MSIIASHVYKILGDPPQEILKDISLEIKTGEFVSLTGRSGSGKSTLLYVLSNLDFPSRGEIIIDGKNTTKMNEDDLHRFRNQHMGFIFQFHYLLPELTALENVLVPTFKNNERIQRTPRAKEILDLVGLTDRMNSLPRHLSGGEQQRVAIARALIMNPKYLFADEPTGSLDTANAETVMQLLEQFNRTEKTTIVMVTHEPTFAKRAQRQIVLSDGMVI